MIDIIDAIKQVHRKAHFDAVKQMEEDRKQASKRHKKATKLKRKWRNKKVRTGKGKV
tara:strand:- start:850 stop:1020 length:171 start_codon:yes stop_codon:yes gene_type:complete